MTSKEKLNQNFFDMFNKFKQFQKEVQNETRRKIKTFSVIVKVGMFHKNLTYTMNKMQSS